MKLTSFKNEALGFNSFEGYTKGETWNGWSCPYFTFEQSKKVLEIYNQFCKIIQKDFLAYYDSEIDAFIFPSFEEIEVYSVLVEKGIKYYPIGSFAWIWEDMEDNSSKKLDLRQLS